MVLIQASCVIAVLLAAMGPIDGEDRPSLSETVIVVTDFGAVPDDGNDDNRGF